MRGERTFDLGSALDWFQALVALGAGTGLILDDFNIIDLEILNTNLSEITFILVCGLILSTFLERRYKLQRIEDIVADKYGLGHQIRSLGVSAIYRDRRELPKFEDYLDRGQADVLIAGITLYGLITRHRDLFEQKLNRGCSFRFLLPASLPNEKEMAHIADEVAVKRTRYDLERTFEEITDLANKCGSSRSKSRVEVRVFDFIPTMGVIMLDPKSRSGRIRIELYPYSSPVDKRPALELQPTRGDGLYEYIQNRYESLWHDSRRYEVANERHVG